MPQNLHILYMEDNEGSARLLEKRLSRAGYTIDLAPDGEAGLERHANTNYDIIIVDYNMPGLSGLQVIQHLSQNGEIPPTIMLTGTGNERIAVEALKLGAFDYVVKDIDGVYLDLLPTVIEQARKNQQLIEDKRLAESALYESEERFRKLFEEAPDPYFVHAVDGRLINCNRAVESLFGISADQLIGKTFTEMQLFAPIQLEKLSIVFKQLSSGFFTQPSELSFIRQDGQEIIFDLRMIPIQIQGETQILSIGHDITWRSQAETEMKAHIKQLEILRRIDEELTRNLDINYVQQMALDNMMNLSHANVGSIALIDNMKIYDIHSHGYPTDFDDFYTLEKKSIVTRVATKKEAEWIQDVSTDPDYCPIISDTCSQIAIPLVSQERLIGIVSLETNQADCFNAKMFEFLQLIATRIAVAIDNAQLYDTSQKQIEELQNLNEQIYTLEQLKTDMIRIVSHDLRNPIAVITTSSSLLERTLRDHLQENQQRYLSQIQHALNRMKALITDVLSLENIEQIARGSKEDNSERINFTDIIQEIVENTVNQANRKNQIINLKQPEEAIWINSNKTEIQQAATNLIGNAIKYTPENGTIDILVQLNTDNVNFTVKDTGFGIPQEGQTKLFQPFERIRTRETQTIEGTGLGLYIVKKIIERNHGEIIFSSEYGKGSIFGFTLPVVE